MTLTSRQAPWHYRGASTMRNFQNLPLLHKALNSLDTHKALDSFDGILVKYTQLVFCLWAGELLTTSISLQLFTRAVQDAENTYK